MAKEIIEIKNTTQFFNDCGRIIETRKTQICSQANGGIILMYWELGTRINKEILGGTRAEYGKQIVPMLAKHLEMKFGRSFELRNLRRMMQFAAQFDNIQIVSQVATQLTWTHIIEILPLKNNDAKVYYLQKVIKTQGSRNDLRTMIARKDFERKEIANANLPANTKIPFNTFRDPYLLDTIGLTDAYDEGDLEKAILSKLENFILEFGRGEFAFLESQKRMIVDGEDFKLDLLFYHRGLKRLVAIELKIGHFMPSYEGQMKMYLGWLKEHYTQDGENDPIGLILCTEAKPERIELLGLGESNIAVAEYWTKLPPKEQFESKIQEIMAEAKERLERRKELPITSKKQIQYFYEQKDENDS